MRRANQNPRAPISAHPATGPITAPAIHVLLSFFPSPVDELAVVVAAAILEVGDDPGVAVALALESEAYSGLANVSLVLVSSSYRKL